MINHPIILIPRLIALIIIVIVLLVLRGTLEPDEFRIAAVISIFAFLLLTVAAWVFTLRMMRNPDSQISRQTVLGSDIKSSDGFTAASPDRFAALVGKTGQTVSPLNPAGNIRIEGRVVPVVSQGTFVDADVAVEVISARGAKVIVKPVQRS